MSHWSFSLSAPVITLAALVWLGSGWLCWANWHRRKTAAAAWLEGLRFLTVTLIGITLLRPEYTRQTVRKEQPEVVILNDASGSMDTRDVASDKGVVTREDWLQGATKTNYWRPLEKTAKVIVEDFAKSSTNAPDSGTDINSALEQILQKQKNLKAVLVLTDGEWNAGKSPVSAALALRAQKTPVYTVAVGSQTPLPDLALQPVAAPSYGLLGEQISIPFKIQSYLPHDVKTTVTLTSPRGNEAQKEINIPAFGELQEGIVWAPKNLGNSQLTLRVPVQGDEVIKDNNERTFQISVRSEKLNVLVVESQPRWEYRYLRNALSRDPGVALDCLLYHPGMGPGEGSNYITAFPPSKELLSKYDVVFLGDVGVGDKELSAQDAESIKGLVEQQGSGLVFLPGLRGRELTLMKTPLSDLIPVILDDKKPDGNPMKTEATLSLTTPGRGHFLTRLDNNEDRNDAIWKTLPGFYWSAAVQRAKPGAEVLAVHSTQRNEAGRVPLLVTRPFGNGEVLFMGTDSAWRWRRGVEDKYHYRFWGQVVRWMAHKRHMAKGEGVRLAFSPENPQVGENMYLQGTLTDITGSPKESLTAQIVSPSGKAERIELAAAPGGWGVFQGNFIPREGGQYKIHITGERSGLKLDSEITVQRPQREKIGQPANLAILREIAELTHGAAGGIKELNALIQQISLLPESAPIEEHYRLWASPIWGGGILLLLAIYWIARKVAGMV
jgi:hypothetical protein